MDGPGAARTPYTVTWWKDGEKHTIRRTPPPQLHDLEPGDRAVIAEKKGDDWDAGDKVRVKAINARQPNTVTIEKPDGSYTFVPFFDLDWKKGSGGRKGGVHDGSQEYEAIPTDYLLWP